MRGLKWTLYVTVSVHICLKKTFINGTVSVHLMLDNEIMYCHFLLLSFEGLLRFLSCMN